VGEVKLPRRLLMAGLVNRVARSSSMVMA
jgi:hypothetical protein